MTKKIEGSFFGVKSILCMISNLIKYSMLNIPTIGLIILIYNMAPLYSQCHVS